MNIRRRKSYGGQADGARILGDPFTDIRCSALEARCSAFLKFVK
jgi:hypothetical protein